MIRRLLAVLATAAAAAALLAASPALAAPHQETYKYVAGPGDLTAINCDGSLKVTAVGLGGTCFDVLRGDTRVDISVTDATSRAVSMTYIFRDAAGDIMGDFSQFCGAVSLTVPVGAQALTVYVDTALAATSPCGGTPGTTGTITGAFS